MKQDRKFEIVLYEESDDYNADEILAKAVDLFDEWAYILHDKDKKEDGTDKKPHYHFYGRFSGSEKTLTPVGVAKQIGLKKDNANMVQFVKRWDDAIKYLIHKNSPNKTPYEIEQITSNFDVRQVIEKEDKTREMARVGMILEYVTKNANKPLSEIANWAYKNDCWSEFRRNYAILRDLRSECMGLREDEEK